MSSREVILSAVKKNQPVESELPELNFPFTSVNIKDTFRRTLTAIGGRVVDVTSWNEIVDNIKATYSTTSQVVNTIQELSADFGSFQRPSNPHDLKEVTVAIMKGDFGVAENGAIWLTDEAMGNQVLPYICEHLVLVINAENIIPTLHEAYERIGNSTYTLGTFLAGPSKTADIEQSLVLGAHGPKSLLVFMITS
jgi:L-lactate dehydrogenase complex protein LldG